MSEYKFIFSDLAKSASILLDYHYGSIYNGFLHKREGWYIDDRASPDEFWALMSLAHPNLMTSMRKVNKSLLKKGIDILFRESNIHLIRQRIVYEKERDEKEEDEENYSDHIVYLEKEEEADEDDLPEGILYIVKGEIDDKVKAEIKRRFL
jgi:hypothetical protein